MRNILIAESAFPAFDHQQAIAGRSNGFFCFAAPRCDDKVAAGLPGGIGRDNIELNGAKKRDIPVGYVPNVGADEIADDALGGSR
ncbi:hypothetical protein AB7008_09340 [Bradyrhizobium sp. 521_C7_N1_3]|uniref:hypothetical protein n=1 Tax=Bradyrhizobium sp. 521_C7_N1_3 TaxID=3240368 RepID=UPI003F893823